MNSKIIHLLRQHNITNGLSTKLFGSHAHVAVCEALEHQKVQIPVSADEPKVIFDFISDPLEIKPTFAAEIPADTRPFIKKGAILYQGRNAVLKVVNGRIENWHGHHVLHQAGLPLYEYSSVFAPLRLIFTAEVQSSPPVAHFSSVFSFCNDISPHNYCHFFVDWMCRAYALHKIPTSVDALVFPEFTQLAFHSSFFTRLEDLGFRLFFLKQGESLDAENIYFTTYGSAQVTGHPAFNCHRETLSFLRDFWPATDARQPMRDILWVSRPQSRRLLEESALIERLQKRYTLTCVDFSNMPPPQQAELAGAHRAMMGVHGAGFTNACFLPPSSKVLEIFCRDNGTPAFQLMAVAMGHSAYAYIGQRVERAHSNYPDIRVDLDRLVSFIDSVMAV